MARNGEMTAAADHLLARDTDLSDAEFLTECEQFLARWHTMPKPLSDRRKARLRHLKEQGRSEGRMVAWIADHLGFNPNRFSKLTSLKPEVAQ